MYTFVTEKCSHVQLVPMMISSVFTEFMLLEAEASFPVPAAILDFRSGSERKSRDRKSKMAAGSHVTSQIQDGGRK